MAKEPIKKPEPAVPAVEEKSLSPKYVVLDANVFIADYWLRSPSFVLLRDFLKKTNATLVVPKVVFQEVVNHHEEDLRKAKSDIQRALREAGRLIRDFKGRLDPIVAISRKSKEDSYEKFLSSQLASLNSRIPDYDGIPHTEVVDRDLRRRKPFQESGKGYRDTLLWETILRNSIEKGVVTIFITKNVRDFCDAAGELHEDLKDDVVRRKGDKDSLVLFRDLPAFTDAYIVPYLRKRRDFAVLVANKKVPGLDLENVCDQNIDALTEALNRSPSTMIGDPGQYEPEVDVIYVPKDFDIEEASEVSKDLLLIVFEFEAEVAFIYFLPHGEYFTMSAEESKNIAILESEWNEYVMRVESTTTVRFSCRLTFNSNTQEVESFEVDEVESVDEY